MKIRLASALLAFALPALPVFAQDANAQAEGLFYKAFYLEKGTRDFAGAMSLYEQFLAQAPEHKLAGEAAKQQYALLDKTGKTKERDAFKAKYEKLLGNVAAAGGAARAEGERPARGEGERPARGEGGERPARGEGAGPGGGARMDPAARVAELEKAIEKAKAEGNEEEVKRLSQQLERAKQFGAGGRGPGGQGGRMAGGMLGSKKLTEMTAEELGQFKDNLGMMEGMLERMRERLTEEQAKTLETNLGSLKKSLDENKLEDAQKSLDAIRAAMPQRRRGGEGAGPGQGGGEGGGRGQGGGEAGGRGGNRGGGGGGGR